jgi:hypothetical protein
LYDDVVKRRDKHCYDDECCIAPGELDEEDVKDTVEQQKRMSNEKISSNGKQIEMKRQVSGSSSASGQPKKKRLSPSVDENVKPTIKEIVPKGRSPSPSTVKHLDRPHGSMNLVFFSGLDIRQGQSEEQ